MIKTRLKVYDPDGLERGMIPLPTEWTASTVFCDIGAMTLGYAPNAAGFDLINTSTPFEIGFEYSTDGVNFTEMINGRFIRIERALTKAGPDKVKKFTMPSYGWLLNKMRNLKTTGLNEDGKRPFNSANVGMIMKTLIDESKLRGACPGLTYDFNSSVDSNGAAWNKIISIAYEPGLDMFTILNNLALQGLVDWCFQGRTLRIFNADNFLATVQDLTLLPGKDIQDMPVQGSIADMVHSVLVLGDAGKRLTQQNAAAPLYWGKWEGFVSQGGVSDTGTMTLFATNALDDGAREQVQYTATMHPQSRYDPLVNFQPGHYIKLPDETGAIQQYRLRGVNFGRDAQGERKIDLVINDRFVEKSIRQARRTNGITGGAAIGGSGTTPTVDPARRTPAAPTGFIVSSEAYTDPVLQVARSIVIMNWNAVTVDNRGIALEIDGYETRAQKSGMGTVYNYWGSTTQTSSTYSPLIPDETWAVQVRARSAAGVNGVWSAPVNVTTAGDATPPEKPSAPALTTKLGTLTINWNGRDFNDAPMPADFRLIQVWRSNGTDPAVLVGTIPAGNRIPLVITDVTIGETYEYFFIGEDKAGNVSIESDHSSIEVASIMDDPAAALDIQSNIEVAAGSGNINTYSAADAPSTGNENRRVGDKWFKIDQGQILGIWRWDSTLEWVSETMSDSVIASIDAGKITTGTLAAARIAASSITADKIDAGAITAVKLSSDAIDGKTINVGTLIGGLIRSPDRTAYNTGSGIWIGSNGYTNILGANGDRLFTADPPSMTVGFGISPNPFLQYNANTGTLTIEKATLRSGTSGARYQIDSNGRYRVWTAESGNPLFLDINPTITSQNMLVNGAVRMDALNLAYSGSPRGILTAGPTFTDIGGPNHARIVNRLHLATVPGYAGGDVNVVQYRVSDGLCCYFSSASKYKIAIKEHEIKDDAILDLRVHEWKDKGLSRDDPELFASMAPTVGLIAEHVAEAGLEEFVIRNAEGEIDTVRYDTMWLALLPTLRRMRADIDELKGR